MPALIPTTVSGEVVWLGAVPDRDRSLRSKGRDTLRLWFAGPEGEAHAGLTRASCVRVKSQHPVGTTIRNVRQVTILSDEELAAIAAKMGLDRLDPLYLGATVVLRGIPDLTHLPPSSRLQGPDGATLVVDMQNHPCHLVSREIEADFPGQGGRFKTAAAGRRGVTGWVEREGTLRIGDRLLLHVPEQRAWHGADMAASLQAL